MSGIEISVLCPTRGRLELLRRSYESLMTKAEHPESIEFLAAVDPDDPGLEFQSWPGPSFSIWTAPERYGYQGIHRYYEELAKVARGRWLMIWNDDAEMLTYGWDTAITSNSCDQVLWPNHNGGDDHNAFPIWPAAWTIHLGHISRVNACDTWTSLVGRLLGRERKIPVQLMHHRNDLTGENNDETWAGRCSGINFGALYTPDAVNQRTRDAESLREAGL